MAEPLPWSEACERNKEPILAVLRGWLAGTPTPPRVLEVGSGTGQHGVHVCRHLAVRWQLSDRTENLAMLARRRTLEGNRPGDPGTLLPPLELDVTQPTWPPGPFEAVFSANTTHIMPAAAVPHLLAGSARVLVDGGLMLLYGPFHDGGDHTSDSNAAFDAHLRSIDPAMGLRDALEVVREAAAVNLEAIEEVAMPANNRALIFRKGPGGSAR
jgi:SAM-dependent methyltransferase